MWQTLWSTEWLFSSFFVSKEIPILQVLCGQGFAISVTLDESNARGVTLDESKAIMAMPSLFSDHFEGRRVT